MRISTRSSWSVIPQLVFQLVFLGAGGYGLYRGLASYLGGSPITSPEAFVPVLVGAVFVAMAGWSVVRLLREEDEEPRSPPEEAPWTVRPNWTTDEIPEDPSDASLKYFAVLWNVIAWPLAGFVLYEAAWQASDPEWGAYFVLLFPASGLLLGWLAVKQVLHRWKFGRSTLVMETMPGRLGRRLRARLQTGVPSEEVPEDGFHVRLSCYHRYVRVTRDSDGTTDRDVKKDLKWRDEKHMRGRPLADGQGTEVPISFEVPPDLPPSPPYKTEDRILWELDASAELSGLDYEGSFEIPVFEPADAGSPSPESDSAGPPQPESSEAESEEVFWEMGEAEASDGELQRDRDAAPERDPYAQHEIGGDFREPVSDGIRMEGRPGRGLTFSFAPGRAKGMAMVLTLLGGGMLVGGVFAFSGSFLFGLVLLGFGGLISYGAWQKWTHASTVSIDDGHVEVTMGPFGKGTTRCFPCSALEDVEVQARGSAGDTTYYALALTLADSATQGSKGRGARLAQWMKGVGGEQASGVAEQVEETVEAATQSVRVAGDLSNKQEADWIADRLVEAAEREASFH